MREMRVSAAGGVKLPVSTCDSVGLSPHVVGLFVQHAMLGTAPGWRSVLLSVAILLVKILSWVMQRVLVNTCCLS